MQKVVVIGGGLAGLTASLELVTCGFDVTLYESTDHLGGKAASLRGGNVYNGAMNRVSTGIATTIPSDHGYHVFPQWYVNMRQLWRRIGLTDAEVFESGEYLGLNKGPNYDFAPPEPKAERERFSLIDLMTRDDEEVDKLTLRGFFYSRIYNDLDSVSLNALFLNALSIPETDISSRVVRNLFRQWFPVFEDKNWAALKGSLGEVLIDKIEAAIREAANNGKGEFTCHLEHSLEAITVDKNKLTLEIIGPKGSVTIKDPPIVMAIPLDKLREKQSDALYEAEPAIAKLNYLRAHPFGALDIYFKKKLPGIPADHFDLLKSEYYLSAFDISQHWPALRKYPGTVMQFVAGNCKGFSGLTEEAFMRTVLDEIREYFPDANSQDIKFLVPHANTDTPLFVNDVATWDNRPKTVGEHFYFAGDFVQNDTDITSMEGAVRSGMNAAEAIRAKYSPNSRPVPILPPMGMTQEKLKEIRSGKILPGKMKMFLQNRLGELLEDL